MNIDDRKTIPAITKAPNQYIRSPQINKYEPAVDTSVNQSASAHVVLSEKAVRLSSSSQLTIDQNKVEKAKKAIHGGHLVIDTNKIINTLVRHLF